MIDKSQAGHPYIKGTAVPADRGDLDFVIRLRSGPSTSSAQWYFLLLLKRVTVSAGPKPESGDSMKRHLLIGNKLNSENTIAE